MMFTEILTQPVPETLVARVARFLAKQAAARAQARLARAKPAQAKRRG